MPSLIPRQVWWNLFARTVPSASAFPRVSAGRLLRYTFRGLLSVHSRYGLHARQVTHVTLYTGGSDGFVTSTAAPIATEWNEPVLGRDFHPQRTSAFHGAQHSSTSSTRFCPGVASSSWSNNRPGTTPHTVPAASFRFSVGLLRDQDWRGKILSGGADQQLIGSDGVAEISARYVMRTHSGDLIHVIKGGIRRGRPEVMAQLNSGLEVNPTEYYFRIAPRFESSAPSCAWLMQSIFVGWCQRLPSKVIVSVWKTLVRKTIKSIRSYLMTKPRTSRTRKDARRGGEPGIDCLVCEPTIPVYPPASIAAECGCRRRAFAPMKFRQKPSRGPEKPREHSIKRGAAD